MLYECIIECSNCEPCYHIESVIYCPYVPKKRVTWRLLTETEELEYIKDKWREYFKDNPFIKIEDFNIT